ncbi:lipase 3-like [Stomoxys calcitrans]|uniref:lipase 3-like n=1 Tax=Stomoxys calcitrans TaxID=35570 RepID=UPI0027E29240|nr:lipase 3-like [Stomoxys calcitrans]
MQAFDVVAITSAMKAWFLICTFTFSFSLELGALSHNTKSTADRILDFGYHSETHKVTTTDGYGLTLFRIRPARIRDDRNPNGPVVLMMHGLMSSSDGWVINGPSQALAFLLAEAGYDIWLGNARGNPYSQQHRKWSNATQRFWHFSIHEIGIYDLPAIMDYILHVTQQTSLHYVGHSQGCMILLILLSTHKEYNDKIRTAHLLAPVAFMKHANQFLLRLIALLFARPSPLNALIGDRPLLQSQLIMDFLGGNRCRPITSYPLECSNVLFLVSGGWSGYFNKTLLPSIFATHPASCSTNQYIHLAQLHVTARFHAFDFGREENLLQYSRPEPPAYDLSKINTLLPIHIYYSDYDEFASKRDVEYLIQVMGKRAISHFVDLPQFTHTDFIWAINVKETINRPILDIMNQAEGT